jgi:hypothetical protein
MRSQSTAAMVTNKYDGIGIYGAPGEIRTPGLFLRREALYPAELRARYASVHREHSRLQLRVRRTGAKPDGNQGREATRRKAS